jgi:hypothetical protein
MKGLNLSWRVAVFVLPCSATRGAFAGQATPGLRQGEAAQVELEAGRVPRKRKY